MITVQDKTVTVQLLNQTGGQTHTSDIMVLLKDNNQNKTTFNHNEIVVKNGKVKIYKKSNVTINTPCITTTYIGDDINVVSNEVGGTYYSFVVGLYVKQLGQNLWIKSTGETLRYTMVDNKGTITYNWEISSDEDDIYFKGDITSNALPTNWYHFTNYIQKDTPTDLTTKIKTEDIFYVSQAYNVNSCVIYNNKLYVSLSLVNGITIPTNITYWLEIPSYISTSNSKVLTDGIYYLLNFKNGLNKINSASNQNLTLQPIIIPSYNTKYNKFNNLIIL